MLALIRTRILPLVLWLSSAGVGVCVGVEARAEAGASFYYQYCFNCHGSEGEGLPFSPNAADAKVEQLADFISDPEQHVATGCTDDCPAVVADYVRGWQVLGDAAEPRAGLLGLPAAEKEFFQDCAYCHWNYGDGAEHELGVAGYALAELAQATEAHQCSGECALRAAALMLSWQQALKPDAVFAVRGAGGHVQTGAMMFGQAGSEALVEFPIPSEGGAKILLRFRTSSSPGEALEADGGEGFSLFYYTADGVASEHDRGRGILFASPVNANAAGPTNFVLDVTAEVEALWRQGASHIGFRFDDLRSRGTLLVVEPALVVVPQDLGDRSSAHPSNLSDLPMEGTRLVF